MALTDAADFYIRKENSLVILELERASPKINIY